MRDLAFIPLPRYIESTVATAVLDNVGDPIDAGADNVPVPLAVAGGKPAGTAHVAIASLVDQQSFKELKHFFLVAIEVIAFRLLGLFEKFVKGNFVCSSL